MEKLEERIAEGDYYGALQMYKTLYSRYVNGQEYDQALSIASQACLSLIKYKQVTAATEMGLLFIEAFNGAEKKVDADTKQSIKVIRDAFYAQDCQGPELASILKQSITYVLSYSSKLLLNTNWPYTDGQRKKAAENVGIRNCAFGWPKRTGTLKNIALLQNNFCMPNNQNLSLKC